VQMYGAGYRNYALSFDSVNAVATAGSGDRAWLYDCVLEACPDCLEAEHNWVRLSNDALGYDYLATDFASVIANSSNASDSADSVDPAALDFLLLLLGEW
jgi:hypothetical protein